MKVNVLPRRAFNSPCLRYANFINYNEYINLIRLTKPYANGYAYAIHNNSLNPLCYSGLFKTFEEALSEFNKMVESTKKVSVLRSEGITENLEKLNVIMKEKVIMYKNFHMTKEYEGDYEIEFVKDKARVFSNIFIFPVKSRLNKLTTHGSAGDTTFYGITINGNKAFFKSKYKISNRCSLSMNINLK